MPATNMGSPAALASNPSTGVQVCMDPFSGPTNSPFDARTITAWVNGTPTYANVPSNLSTGALSTGIGFGCASPIFGGVTDISRGFNDDYTPGVSGFTSASTMQTFTNSTLLAIGGGKSTANVNGSAPTVPYNAQPILNFGNGGNRDAGAGPVFTGFSQKTVTATVSTPPGAPVETGFSNRSLVVMASGQGIFGSNVAASQAVA